MSSLDAAEQLTQCAQVAGLGSRTEVADMVRRLYENVRKLATAEMSKAFPQKLDSLTIQPTAIANDAMIRVLNQRKEVQNTDQFFALATRFVHQLIVDYQRHRLAEKRGAGTRGVDLEHAADVPIDESELDVPPMLEMLDQLGREYPRKAEVVSLHVLCGHSLPEVANLIGISLATVERDWSFAKSWLAQETRQKNASSTKSHPPRG